MTKIYVWPDGTWLDADEYSEQDFRLKGDDFAVVDLQAIADGSLVTLNAYDLQALKNNQVPEMRLHELLQAEHELKAVRHMFRNYRTTMREYSWRIPHLKQIIERQRKDYALALSRITELETSSATREEVQQVNKEMADLIAKHETEMRTTLASRDKWVKKLQGKITTANIDRDDMQKTNAEMAEELRKVKSKDLAGTRTATEAGVRLLIAERDKLAHRVVDLECLLSELYQVLGEMDAPKLVLDTIQKLQEGDAWDEDTMTLLPFIRPEHEDNKEDTCQCETPAPYHPSGVCAPITKPGNCLKCLKRVEGGTE